MRGQAMGHFNNNEGPKYLIKKGADIAYTKFHTYTLALFI